jgi:hypothetical protein
MSGRAFFGILWFLITVAVAGAVGFFAYQAGVATHLGAANGAGPYPGPYGYPGWGWGWGVGFGFFHLFGFLFFLLLLFFLFRVIFFAGRFGHRPGGWHEHRQEHFEEMHRRAHGEPPKEG